MKIVELTESEGTFVVQFHAELTDARLYPVIGFTGVQQVASD